MRLCVFGLLAISAIGCRGGTSSSPSPGPKSPAGWEIRYNAALALAHRGSEGILDPVAWESLVEMLDEDQQLRNFTMRQSDGRELPDETAARLTVIGALKAIQSLHRRNPTIDLTKLAEPLAKLQQSGSAAVRAEATATQLTLANK
jgi:hypothetical protein